MAPEPSRQLVRGKRNGNPSERATFQFDRSAGRNRLALALPTLEVKGLRKQTQIQVSRIGSLDKIKRKQKSTYRCHLHYYPIDLSVETPLLAP